MSTCSPKLRNNQGCQLLGICCVGILLHHCKDDVGWENIAEVLVGLILVLWDHMLPGIIAHSNPRIPPKLLHLFRHTPYHDWLIAWLHEAVTQGIGVVAIGVSCTRQWVPAGMLFPAQRRSSLPHGVALIEAGVRNTVHPSHHQGTSWLGRCPRMDSRRRGIVSRTAGACSSCWVLGMQN